LAHTAPIIFFQSKRQSDGLRRLVLEEQIALLQGEMQQIPGNLDIFPAVPGDQIDPAFLVPLERLQAVGALLFPQGMFGQPVETEAIAQVVGHLLQQVEGRQAAEILPAVAAQDAVVEPARVEADHQTREPTDARSGRQSPVRDR